MGKIFHCQYVDFWFPLILGGIPLIPGESPLESGGQPLKPGGIPLKSGGQKIKKLGFWVSIVSPKLKNCHRNNNLKSEFSNSSLEKSYSRFFDLSLISGGLPLKLRGYPLILGGMPSSHISPDNRGCPLKLGGVP